jgi:hypothetical protein
MGAAVLLGGTSDDVWRWLGVLGILDVLGTVATITLARAADREVDHPGPVDGRVRVTLSGDVAADLEVRARISGRLVDHLVAEAVDRYLHSAAAS